MLLKGYALLFSLCTIAIVIALCQPAHVLSATPAPFEPVVQSSAQSCACSVASLAPILDPQARAFEGAAGPEVVDTRSLTQRAFHALVKFVSAIRSVGGAITLRSAYRPPAYQQHLQQVWDKWMALRNNQSATCQGVRAQVRAEFVRHQLIESQRPVSSSDHTRGLAFDANVTLPRMVRVRRHRLLNLDALARLAGLRRPDIQHDPVHFKFVE